MLGCALWRRFRQLKRTVREVGLLGTTIAGMAAVTLSGLALFGLRIIPGPSFTVGAVLATIVIFTVWRVRARLHIVPRLIFPRRADPLIILAILAGLFGLVLSFHTAYIIDVRDVDNILGAFIGVWNP
jgi:hypothetical protein